MIDFAKITNTVGGLDCYYLGQRRSAGRVLHRFAVVNDVAELICYYNDQGQRIEYVAPGKWVATPTGHQIIAPPKIVEVNHFIGLYKNSHGDFFISTGSNEESLSAKNLVALQKHTFRFEVPNE